MVQLTTGDTWEANMEGFNRARNYAKAGKDKSKQNDKGSKKNKSEDSNLTTTKKNLKEFKNGMKLGKDLTKINTNLDIEKAKEFTVLTQSGTTENGTQILIIDTSFVDSKPYQRIRDLPSNMLHTNRPKIEINKN